MRPHGDVDRTQMFADNVIIIGKYTRIYMLGYMWLLIDSYHFSNNMQTYIQIYIQMYIKNSVNNNIK